MTQHLSTFTRVVILTAFYFVGGIAGKDSTFMNGTVSLVWPASGIALAAVLLFGYRFLPGVALGAMLVSMIYVYPKTFAAASALGSCAGAVVCTYLLRRFGRFSNHLERISDVVALIIYGAFMGTTVNATFNAMGICLAGEAPWSEFYELIVVWWVPNAMAVLVVTPCILAWATGPRIVWKASGVLEAIACGTLLVIGTLVSFNSWYVYGVQSYPFAYLPYPFLVWGALRFGPRGAATGTLMLSALAIYSLLNKKGPFVMPEERDSLMLIGTYLGVLAASNLLLAAAAVERRKAAEQLREARDAALESARMKSEFLANMSHEIRTPMNGIIGMTGLLMDSPLNKTQREFAETIHQCGNSLLTIINDILDFSKIEAGMLRFEKLTFDLRSAVENSVEIVAEQHYFKPVEMVPFVESQVPALVVGDPGRLRQVLLNLVGNAAKFTDRGEVVVTVKLEEETEEEICLEFEVKDTGIGIREEEQKRLFQPFSQADGSTTRKYGGTGLGLVISQKLVQQMGGNIGFESQPGRGATFWFTARFGKADAKARPPAADLPIDWKEVRLLVVDDNATNRKVLMHQLGAAGLSVDCATSGREALELARARVEAGAPYQAALLDYQMPEMDGLQLAAALQQIRPLRILLMSSASTALLHSDLQKSGVHISLTKPVKQALLFESLGKLLGDPEEGEAPASPPADPAEGQPSAERKRGRILLAEDNIVNQKVTMRQLQKMGYSVDAVANGLEVLEAMNRIRYDLILMDCQMPEMDGYQATQEIRRREGSFQHSIIIALTAHAMEGDREKCLSYGMDDYISKPVRTEDLKSVLDRYLAGARE